ncbi:thiamine pyrophosphate-dependent enzyme [Ilumatobacter sp.]|uniref:thiamine pyrophosphate-dependent enzyme n=1 Tax=Ilumatobacter sp. TaxID=1967498 RepID=UPI003C4BB51E
MSDRTISKVLVDGLVAHGVTHVFGVVGDALNSVTEAIRLTDGIDWVGVRHEEVAAYAAGAQAQLTGTLGVCAGTVGPGSIHLLNGLYDAAKSHAPVLAITGQVPLAEIGTDYFQEVDNDHLFRDVSVYNQTIVDGAQVPRVVQEAFDAALAQRGVAVLSIPGDVGPAEVDSEPIRVLGMPRPAAAPQDEIDKAVAQIDAATNVTILAGIGARNARDQVLALADKLAAPIVATIKAKETFDWDNPFNVGQNGLIGNPAAADAFDDADVLVMVGSDFPYRDWFSDSVPVIQIDLRSDHIGRRAPVAVGLVGDAAATVSILNDLVETKRDRSHLDSVSAKYERWRSRQARLADPAHDDHPIGEVRAELDNPEHRIRPEAVAAIVGRMADDDAVFTTDTGMSTVWLSRFVEMRNGQRLLGSFNLGSMANAMPQAIGAQCSFPDRQVIAFCGDGGFTMLLGDLITAVSCELPVKLIVFDNKRLGMVKLEQEEAGLPEFGTVLDNPNLADVATAMGARGIRITDPDDLESGIRAALAHDGPVVVDVLTNPDEILVPSHPSPGQAWGFAIAKVKEFIRSRGDDDDAAG